MGLTAGPVPPRVDAHVTAGLLALAAHAAQAPDLHEALHKAKQQGVTHVILDGKLFGCNRLDEQTTSVTGKQIDAWYSGKHREPAATSKR